jgi:hypothetical protein
MECRCLGTALSTVLTLLNEWTSRGAQASWQQKHRGSAGTHSALCCQTGDPVKAAEEMRAVVKALPDGDSKADDECPICMDVVATGDWQVTHGTTRVSRLKIH